MSNTVIDFRDIQPRARHALFLSIFEGLCDGGQFNLINDHDPEPLHKQLKKLNIPNLTWDYLVTGPKLWSVKISKQNNADAIESDSCCGVCGSKSHGK